MGSKSLAAGVVVYRTAAHGFEYLLLKASYPPFHWTPPKGHVDKGESDLLVTALRETEEEAGLNKTDLLIKDFNVKINYDVKGHPKEVTYFLAQLATCKDVTLSDEHTDMKWAGCDEAVKLIGFATTGDVINKCEDFLTKKNE